jgi:hypothetical protein
MADELHPLIELMLARMESNPEEFETDFGRWEHVLTSIAEHADPASAARVLTVLHGIRLDAAHRAMMEELTNPVKAMLAASPTFMPVPPMPNGLQNYGQALQQQHMQNAQNAYHSQLASMQGRRDADLLADTIKANRTSLLGTLLKGIV